MEKFAIDLDKVLDEFERSEDSNVLKKSIDSHNYNSPINHFYLPTCLNSSSLSENNHNSANTPYSHTEKLDLLAADFSASTSSLSSSHSAFSQLTRNLDSLKLYNEEMSPISDLPPARLNTMVQLSTTYSGPILSNGLDQMVEDVLSVRVTHNAEIPNSNNFEIKLLPGEMSNDDLSYVVHFPSFSGDSLNCDKNGVILTEIDNSQSTEVENEKEKPWDNLMVQLVDEVLVDQSDCDNQTVGFAEVVDLSPADLENYLQDLEDIDFQKLVSENDLTLEAEGVDSSLTLDSMSALLDPDVPIDCDSSQSDDEKVAVSTSVNIGGARPKVRDASPVLKITEPPDIQSTNDPPPDYSCQEVDDSLPDVNEISFQSDQQKTADDSAPAKIITRPTSLNLPTPILIDPNQVTPDVATLMAPTISPALSETDSALPPSPDAGGSSQEEVTLEEVKSRSDDEIEDVFADESSPDLAVEASNVEKEEEPELGNLSLDNLTEEEQLLGKIRPFWIPDEEAPNCLHCNSKFTVLKRRHHCRGCGKVLCAQCCSHRAPIAYLEDKMARVCQPCYETLKKVAAAVQVYEQSGTREEIEEEVEDAGGGPLATERKTPNPNNPQEYCSQVSPLQQAQTYAARPPPVVMVPVGVLKRGDKPRREPKQVMFSDGIRPGGDLTELDLSLSQEPKFPSRKSPGRRILDKSSPDYTVEDKPDATQLLHCLKDEAAQPIVFALTKNLFVYIKLVKLECCLHKECWVFTSKGLNCVGQDEVMVLLERLPDEKLLPRDLFLLFTALYDNASMGSPVGELGHLLFPEGLLGSREHGAFLFLRPTYQCLSKLHLPSAPYLVAILLQKWEVPWAKVFPLRLILRIGAEFRYYPCPLVSVRFRKPVYAEIGHTIMSVLADFRNYQYTLATIPGVMVCMEDKKTTVCFPRNRYAQVLRLVANSNEHVLGLAASFSLDADSHLVCIQDDEGNYQTQAINIQNTPRKVTGASFIVFSGALKTSTGLTAKSSIVEDGLLVQITSDTMAALKNSFQEMKDFIINCGQMDAPEEQVILKWTHNDRNFNIGVRSPVDGQCLDGVESMRIHSGTDYSADKHLIRWTEVFFLNNESTKKGEATFDGSKLADSVAQACCLALVSHLAQLSQDDLTKIGLRVTLDSEKVGYEVGSKEEPLPSAYMVDLDSALIPVITGASSSNVVEEGLLTLELIFHILRK